MNGERITELRRQRPAKRPDVAAGDGFAGKPAGFYYSWGSVLGVSNGFVRLATTTRRPFS